MGPPLRLRAQRCCSKPIWSTYWERGSQSSRSGLAVSDEDANRFAQLFTGNSPGHRALDSHDFRFKPAATAPHLYGRRKDARLHSLVQVAFLKCQARGDCVQRQKNNLGRAVVGGAKMRYGCCIHNEL